MGEEYAGRLRRRLAVERWADDEAGGAWTDAGMIWGEVSALASRVAGDGGAERLRGRMRVRARDAGVDASCRLWIDGRSYAVLSARSEAPGRQELLIEERGS